MTERIHTAHRQNQRRMAISIALALVIHAGIFVAFQYGIRLHPEELPDYSGPITVTLYESVETPETKAPAAVKAVVQPEKKPEIVPQAVQPTQKAAEKTAQTLDSKAAETTQKIQSAKEKGTLPVPVQERTVGTEGPVEEAVNVPTSRLQAPTMGMAPDEHTRQPARTARESPAVPETKGTEEGQVTTETPKDKFSFPPVEEEKPLDLDMERLEQALEKTQTTAESTQRPTVAEGAQSTGAPRIEWEDASRGRTLLASPVLPVIPSWVEKEGLSLTVTVSFEVTPPGHTTSLIVKQSSGYSDVDSSVLEAVRKLRFNPITENRNARGTIRYIISAR